MFVIAVETAEVAAQRVPWTGRRHDDDDTESTGEQTAQGLFDAVFSALHDGEQVALGFDCPLSSASPSADPEAARATARAVDQVPGLTELRRLVHELGTWRPWTIVTTSLPRWRATTSVLLWEAAPPGVPPREAIDAFFAAVRGGDHTPAPAADEALVNLAAAAAIDSAVAADAEELTQPVLRIVATGKVRAAAR